MRVAGRRRRKGLARSLYYERAAIRWSAHAPFNLGWRSKASEDIISLRKWIAGVAMLLHYDPFTRQRNAMALETARWPPERSPALGALRQHRISERVWNMISPLTPYVGMRGCAFALCASRRFVRARKDAFSPWRKKTNARVGATHSSSFSSGLRDGEVWKT